MIMFSTSTLEIHSPPDLMRSFCAIGDLQIAFPVQGGHVPRLEPPVLGEAGGALRIVVVGAHYPWAAHLDFAHAATITQKLCPVLAHDPELDAGRDVALLGPRGVALFIGPALHITLEATDCSDGRGFRHPQA
jgi:hypothetical protein